MKKWIFTILCLFFVTGNTFAQKKKVLLLGDSITNHYSKYVIEAMTGKADVYRGKFNATWTTQLLEKYLTPMLEAENCKWDVIWFNVGIWDITIIGDRAIRKNPELKERAGQPKTPIDEYEKNLHEIIKRIRAHSPNVKLVFATTSPTPEGVELKYNPVAKKVMKDNKVTVFDLHLFTKERTDVLLWKENIHYSTVADKLIAPHVAKAISSVLESKPFPHVTGTIPISEEMIPVLEKERDLGHPKKRGRKKK